MHRPIWFAIAWATTLAGACARPAPAPAPAPARPPEVTAVVDVEPCSSAGQPHFEFQTERPAEFIPDTTVSPRPGRQALAAPLLVQFVVDPTGRPEPGTLKVLRAPPDADIAAIRAALPRWRFRPALVDGCAVRQLVQTLIER